MYKTKNRKAKHWLKIGAWVVGVATFLFVGLLCLTLWLEHKAESMVQEQSDGVYSLNLVGLQLSPFIGNVTVDSLILHPDFERWQQLNQQEKETPAMLMNLNVGTIKLRNLNVLGILFGEDANLERLEVQQPELEITSMREDTTEQQRPLHETLGDRAKGLQVGTISLQNARLHYKENPDAKSDRFAITGFDLTISELQLDSQSYQAQDRAYYASMIDFKAREANMLMANGFYRFHTDSIKLNTQKGTLSIHNIKSKALLSAAEMSRQKSEAVTYYDFEVPAVLLTGIDYGAHFRNKSILASRVDLEGIQFSAYKNKKNFSNEGPKPLPHDLVQQIKADFSIDTVNINNMYVRYDELGEDANETGHITFESLNGSITNLSNMPERMTMDNPAVVEASAMIMGKMPVSILVHLPLLAKNGHHRLVGDVGEGSPELLNPILEPTNFITIESGYVQKGHFEAELNNESATGTMRIIYSNFEAELLSKDEDKRQGLGKEVLSEVANWALIKSSNPGDKGEKPRIGNIAVTRNKDRSFFTYWKDCAASGFLSSAGLDMISEK